MGDVTAFLREESEGQNVSLNPKQMIAGYLRCQPSTCTATRTRRTWHISLAAKSANVETKRWEATHKACVKIFSLNPIKFAEFINFAHRRERTTK